MNPTAELEGWSEEDLAALLREDERPLKCDRCDGTGSYRYSDGQGGGYMPCEGYSWPGYGLMASRLAEARGKLAAAQKEIKVLKEESDLAFDAGYDAAQESVSEWLEAPEK